MLRWVDYLYSVEGSRLAQSGLEGVEYTINADGTWYWIDDIETVASSVLADATIADGANTPDTTRWNCSSPMTAATPSAWFPPCRS